MKMFRLSLDSQGHVTVGLKTHYGIFNIFLFIFIIIKMPFYSPSTLEIRRLRKNTESTGRRERTTTNYLFFLLC